MYLTSRVTYVDYDDVYAITRPLDGYLERLVVTVEGSGSNYHETTLAMTMFPDAINNKGHVDVTIFLGKY